MVTCNIHDFARYIGLSCLTKGLSISPLKLQKLLYYVQAWYMALHGREHELFAERPQAWVNGPVYPSVYHEYKGKVPGMCDHLTISDFTDEVPESVLSRINSRYADIDFELIESIILLYGAKTQNELIFLTHCERPWMEARDGLRPFDRSDRELSLDTLCAYYRERRTHNSRRHEA